MWGLFNIRKVRYNFYVSTSLTLQSITMIKYWLVYKKLCWGIYRQERKSVNLWQARKAWKADEELMNQNMNTKIPWNVFIDPVKSNCKGFRWIISDRCNNSYSTTLFSANICMIAWWIHTGRWSGTTKNQNHTEMAVQVLQKVDVVPTIIWVTQVICFGNRM